MTAAVLLLTAVSAADLSPAARQAALNATARVQVLDRDRTGSGTAVAVGKKDGWAYFLTAAHVVGNTVRMELQTFTPESYPAPAQTSRRVEVVGRFEEPDVAVLRIPLDESAAVPLELVPHPELPRRFPVPLPVWSVGCPNGLAPLVEPDRVLGKVLVEKSRDVARFFWQTESRSVPGRSGGPLVGADGRVLGICSATQENRGYYSHGDEILAVLKRHGFDWLVRGSSQR